jgi:hypothetical protein
MVLPNIREAICTDGTAFMAAAAMRTVSAPDSAYSAAFDRLEGMWRVSRGRSATWTSTSPSNPRTSSSRCEDTKGRVHLRGVQGAGSRHRPLRDIRDGAAGRDRGNHLVLQRRFRVRSRALVSPDFAEGEARVEELASELSQMVDSIECNHRGLLDVTHEGPRRQ